MSKSKGEILVRTDFNVAEGDTKDVISSIKVRHANMINQVNELELPVGKYDMPEFGEKMAELGRLKSLAITHLETAAMLAVKAATV